MISIQKFLLLFIFSGLYFTKSAAQCDPVLVRKYTPPLNRQLFHDEVNIEQKSILKFDGKDDDKLTVSLNEEINFLLTKAVTDKVDCLQYQIEKDSTLTSQRKIFYIRKIATLLNNLQKGWKSGQAERAARPGA